MNERIQKLAEQAGFDLGNGRSYKVENFAELIVRTCIAKCDDLNSMKYIAQHFGIQIQGLTDE